MLGVLGVGPLASQVNVKRRKTKYGKCLEMHERSHLVCNIVPPRSANTQCLGLSSCNSINFNMWEFHRKSARVACLGGHGKVARSAGKKKVFSGKSPSALGDVFLLRVTLMVFKEMWLAFAHILRFKLSLTFTRLTSAKAQTRRVEFVWIYHNQIRMQFESC